MTSISFLWCCWMSQQKSLLLWDDFSIIFQGVTEPTLGPVWPKMQEQNGIKFLKSIPSNSGMTTLHEKHPQFPLLYHNHNSDIQASTFSFVLPEPKGFGSLFTTHATHPSHSLRRTWWALSSLAYYKWSRPYQKFPGGEQSREHKALLQLTFVFGVLFCWQELTNRGWRLGRGFDYLVCPEVETQADTCRHRCQLYLAILCQPVHVEVGVAMQTW